MADSFSVTTKNSWGGRIVSALTGIVIGILFIPGSIVLLSWNEGNSVATTRSLKEGAAAVIDISADKVDPANDGKLVHVTGEATTTEEIEDPVFKVSALALRLERLFEMYQWKETESEREEKKLGGGSETVKTYTYDKVWSDTLIDSSDFKQPQGHENPTSMSAKTRTFKASEVTLGAFRLPGDLVDLMSGDVPLTPSQEVFDSLPADIKEDAHLTEDGIFFGKDPGKAAVGDERVSFTILKPGTFSILAQQTGGTFQPYLTKNGREIERVESGTVGAAQMFKHAADENALFTWLLRLVGFIVMAIGFALIFKPLSVLGDVVPFIGSLIGAGTGLLSILLALVGTLVTIAIAWVVVRPLLGGLLLVISVVVLVWAFRTWSKRPKKAS